MNVVGYAFEEAWASVRRAGRSAAVSIGTIAIAFLTLGGFMLVSVNVQRVLDRWLESAEVSVYLYDDLSDELRSELATYVRQQPAVAAVEFVSKQKALERFRADFPELLDVTNAVGQNPFPAALEIRLRSDATGTAAVDELTTGLAGRDGVADVRYDRRWLTRLAGIVTTAQVAAGVVAAVLMLGAAFTVAAVVRLSLHARREDSTSCSWWARPSATFVVHPLSRGCCWAAPGPRWRSGELPCYSPASRGGWGPTWPA